MIIRVYHIFVNLITVMSPVGTHTQVLITPIYNVLNEVVPDFGFNFILLVIINEQ